MRQERTVQGTLFDSFAAHEIGRELQAMSQWLDEHRDVLGLVVADLRRHGLKDTVRHGLTAEAVLRCALLKQHRQSDGCTASCETSVPALRPTSHA